MLRVFTGPGGRGGNPLGVFLDGAGVPAARRQAVAAELGFSETVYVDDRAAGRVAIFTPVAELAFAGHPLVGVNWLLAEEGSAVDVLRPPAGEVRTRFDEDGLSCIAGRPEWAPQFVHVELGSAAEVDALAGPPDGHGGLVAAWAWADESAAEVRSRVFAVALGIEEDEATGAAALRLGALLGRPITIRQGRGSEIRVRPLDEGYVEVAGRVVLDAVREDGAELRG